MSDPMIVRARVAAPVKKVHEALTDPAALRVWLAEHAEVDPPDRYEFWGRHTPEGSAPHQHLLHLDERTVRFAWDLDGERTTTEFSLEEDGPDATIVSVSQTHFSFEEALAESTVRGVLMTYWCLTLANLAEYIDGRPLTPKVDFTSPDLRASVLIAATPQAVFDSLVDSEEVTRWFGYPVEIDPVVGGRVAMGGSDGDAAKILELEPGAKLTIDWGSTGLTTWELADSDGRTRLTIIQSGFDGRPPYAAWAGNLSGLSEFRRYHEIPGWEPIWRHAPMG